MYFMLLKKKHRNKITRVIVAFLLLSILNQVIAPTVAFALTSGPTAPEATSFEPIDTTDMVNPLTGDFTYNLPLLEVPGPEGGYPLSLSYHAGIQPNEDASWVGLGWTLNPGAITRSVNGFPDDWVGTNVSRRDYWDGGTQTTYNIGVSLGAPGPAGNVSFGLSFSQDTYRGFGIGANVGLGLGIGQTGLGWNVGVGVSPFGDAYISAGVDYGIGITKGISGSIGLGITTNFESISGNASGGIGYSIPSSSGKSYRGSLLGASISSEGGSPSFAAGGMSASTENNKAGNISTSSTGFSIGIPILPLVNINLGYSKVRYWSDETSNTSIIGSLTPLSIGAPDDQAYDNYGLRDMDDPIFANVDPGKGQGGAFPDFDIYTVCSQGLNGSMRPYHFQGQLLSQNRKDANNTRLIQYFRTRSSGSSLSAQSRFRFVNDFSNSYRQTYPDYSSGNVDLKATEPPFDNNPQYGNSDGTFGYEPFVDKLAGSKSIEYFTTSGGTIIGTSGSAFIQPTANGLIRNLHASGSGHIEGFKITNSSGVTYHYNLPAYSYGEELYQEKIGGNSSNRQIRTEGYAYTWYLTSITGPDYVDKNNNQKLDEGDWGYWVNFEYGKWCDDYVWRNPSEGYHRDEDNAFQDVSMGKKELYYLNAIRTRSHIAIFEKETRLDAKGASSLIFNKAAQNRYEYTEGIFDANSAKSLKLNKIYLLNTSDANLVTPGSSGTSFYGNVIDNNDIDAVGRSNVEAKAIRVIDFNYDYNLCKGTTNSFDPSAVSQKSGKLSLSSLRFRGVGGANLTPPIEFEYNLSGSELKTASGTLSSTSFLSSSSTFEVGDLLETDEISSVYCGVIIAKEQTGSNYLYTLKKSRYSAGSTTKQVRTTKNPPYDKDAFDMWGTYKSDYEYSLNENFSRLTSSVSNQSSDVWSLRKIKTNLGSEITVNYEGDTYNKSVLNKNLSMMITDFNRVAQNSWVLTINTNGQDLRKFYKINDEPDFLFLLEYYQLIPPNGYDTRYTVYSPLNSAGFKPYVENVTANELHIKVSSEFDFLMDGYYDLFGNGGSALVTGNIKVTGGSKYYGGGIRVKSMQIDDMLANQHRTNYSYNLLDNSNSSGVTSYEPVVYEVDGAAQYGQLAKDTYRNKLYQEMDQLFQVAREVPAPGVMYEYVTVENEVYHPGSQIPVKSDGKTVYQFEVFRNNMAGKVQASAAQSGSANGRSQSIKNLVFKKFIASLGALKGIIRYDSQNKKLSETINHYLHDGLENLPLTDFMNQYEQRLNQFYYQGLLKERYSEVKEVRQNNGSYNVKATFSAKEEFPAVPLGQTTKDYVSGVEMGTENLAFDFYSGALTKMISKDAYGNRFLTEIEPAYRKYSAMGLKSMNGSFGNMLTQEASKTVYKVNTANQYQGVVSAFAQTWSNDIRVDDENGDLTTYGQSGVWRSKVAYQWMTQGTSANNITPIGLFTSFNHSGSNASVWKKIGEVTRYNVYSAALEATDINNHYASSKMGYKSSKVIVSASPARHMEIAYTGAEDGFLPNGKFSSGVALGSGTIDNSVAHTGSKSINLAAGTTGLTYQVALSDLDPTRRDYQISVWVKSADVSNARLFYEVDNQGAQMVTPTFQKTAAGWYLLEMRVPASALVSGNNLVVGCKNIGGAQAINFDDFRFQPFNAPTTSYVYDNTTGQVTYILDNNNLFVKYEYDAIGRLVKVYKEVLGKSAIPLVKEIAYNYAKPLTQ